MSYNNEYITLAAFTNDIAALKSAIKAGIDINHSEGEPLREAVATGYLEMVETILANGGDVNQPYNGQWGVPLSIAARSGDIPMLNCLLHAGASIYELATGVAVRTGKTVALKTLKAHGATIAATDEDIDKALIGRYSATVQFLVEHGTDDTQFSAILHLATRGFDQVIQAIMNETDYLPSDALYDRLQTANLDYFLHGIANRELNKRLSLKFAARPKEQLVKI